MLNKTSTYFGSTITSDFSLNDYSNHNLINFEKITLFLSTIGPILIIIFLALIIPKANEFNSISSYIQLHKFSDENLSMLINLMYLLFGSGFFSLVGLLLYEIYKKNIILIFNFISLFISFGLFIPTYIMIIGD